MGVPMSVVPPSGGISCGLFVVALLRGHQTIQCRNICSHSEFTMKLLLEILLLAIPLMD